jgi:hypothetical protein
MSSKFVSSLAVASALGLGSIAFAQSQPPAVSVLRVGANGSAAALSNTAAPVFIDTFASGIANQSGPSGTLAISTTTNGANRRLTMVGNATSEGGLSLSSDGRYLTLIGYDSAVGSASSTMFPASTNRVIARIDSAGNIDTTTVLANGEYSGTAGTNVRGVVSADGSSYYVAGNGTGVGSANTGGVRFVQHGVITSPTSPSVLLAPSTGNGTGNIRRTYLANGQLYAITNSSPFTGVNTIGTGTPTTAAQTMTNIFGTGGSSYDVFFASATVAYLTDTRAIASGGGLQRWNFNGSAWSLAYTLNGGLTGGLSGLAGSLLSGGGIYFAAITANGAQLVTITDNLANIAASGTFTTLATAPTNTAFRGVAIPTPGAASLLAGLGLVAARRRRVR